MIIQRQPFAPRYGWGGEQNIGRDIFIIIFFFFFLGGGGGGLGDDATGVEQKQCCSAVVQNDCEFMVIIAPKCTQCKRTVMVIILMTCHRANCNAPVQLGLYRAYYIPKIANVIAHEST